MLLFSLDKKSVIFTGLLNSNGRLILKSIGLCCKFDSRAELTSLVLFILCANVFVKSLSHFFDKYYYGERLVCFFMSKIYVNNFCPNHERKSGK